MTHRPGTTATARTGPLSGLAGLLLRGALAAALGWAAPAPAPAAAPMSGSDSLTLRVTPRDIWPPAPVADLTATPGAEGQMLLQWTAPDSNFNVLPQKLTRVAAYSIRIATFSVDSVGGSTTAWWNAATDVRQLPPPATPATPPTPAAPGTPESLLLSRLEPGVTHYAMIVSRDIGGLVSDADSRAVSGEQAQALVFDAIPPTPGSLSVTQATLSSFRVIFPTVTVYDLDFYRLYIDSTPPYDFADASTVVRDSAPATRLVTLILPNLDAGTYHFRLAAVDKGAPDFAGEALESNYALFTTAIEPDRVADDPPQRPIGLTRSTAGFTTTLSWLPVTGYENGADFADPLRPTTEELTGYRIYRSTALMLATWTRMAVLESTATRSWTDLAGGPQYYYHVRAMNNNGLSEPSAVLAGGSDSTWVVAADGRAYIELFSKDARALEGKPGDPSSAYLVSATSAAEDAGGRVLRSVDFGARKGGPQGQAMRQLAGTAVVRLRYELDPAGAPRAAEAGVAAVPDASPENISVYWFNGSRWMQLYGRLDPQSQTLSIETKYLGKYQLRLTERTQGFNFDQAGVSNRLITPNGDGKNDSVVFVYDNRGGGEVTVRILDLRGKVVAARLPPGPMSNSKVWTPPETIPGGVYIYQIESAGRVFTGTVVILK